MLQEGSGQKAEAEKTYERALAIDSRAAIAANNLAWLLVDSTRDLDRALGLAQTARSRLPSDPNIADTLGWILVRKQLAAEAIPHLSFAARTATRNPVIHYHLGMAYAGNGDKANARRALQQALAMGQSFPEADAARQALDTLK
jgi:Flp pilus assembly protein TadD